MVTQGARPRARGVHSCDVVLVEAATYGSAERGRCFSVGRPKPSLYASAATICCRGASCSADAALTGRILTWLGRFAPSVAAIVLAGLAGSGGFESLVRLAADPPNEGQPGDWISPPPAE